MYLNIVGTKVSDKGVQALSGIPSLPSVYVFQSHVQQLSSESAKAGNLKIDTGNYTLPALASDTIRY
ncbi:hypothetical protein [Sphingobacterium wenxiniae]|uniref:hypothetical protein n=1 Tax=Sphingobacterium wenxiniae TaxID=683125 RepID=UPI000B838C92|nr:hypothetical protein [Sphingobacterium wenxiniae]